MGTKSTTVIVKGRPVPKQRPKFDSRSKHAYTPAKTREQEELIKWEYLRQSRIMFNGPLEVTCVFVYEPPKYLSKKKQMEMIGKARIAKPDNDNLVKLCLDALNGTAYTDDNQIWKITSEKVYGKEEKTIINISETEIGQ